VGIAGGAGLRPSLAAYLEDLQGSDQVELIELYEWLRQEAARAGRLPYEHNVDMCEALTMCLMRHSGSLIAS
jgi:hypothetical protein